MSKKWFLFYLCLTLNFYFLTSVYGHEGETHGTPAPTSGTYGGPIALSEEAKKNLGLQIVDVEERPIEEGVDCFAEVEAAPELFHLITTRFSGRVAKVWVNQGDKVEAGDLLVEVESRQIGDPPPTVKITSSISGTVVERHVLVGEPIEPDKILFKIVDLSAVRAKCHVYEVDVGKVEMGQKVRLYFEAYPNIVFEGVVDFLGGELEEETRTLPIWCRIENANGKLRPNMRAKAFVVTKMIKDAITVPREAILGDAGNYFVYMEQGDVLVKQPVVLGIENDRFVEIVDGLFPGDRVVTQGNYQLQFYISPVKE